MGNMFWQMLPMYMSAVFLKLLNMSIIAGWLALVIIGLRILFKKMPKTLICVLWGLVGIRLICPVSLESIFSLIPSAETVPQEIIYMQEPGIHSGIATLNRYVNPIISEKLAIVEGTETAPYNPVQNIVFIATLIWLIGMIVMIAYGFWSYLRVYRITRESVEIEVHDADTEGIRTDNTEIWLCDHIATPFIFGIYRPRIYLPSAISTMDAAYVIAHEKAHLKRRDHWWKPIGFALLTVYWFNPLMWAAYILLCRDIELACDERVIKDMGAESKKPYLEALIRCSSAQKIITACPLAFGEVDVKRRVKNVLRYKKPAFWILILAVLVCTVVAVCFLTNPPENTKELDLARNAESIGVSIPDSFIGTADLKLQSITYACDNSPELFSPIIHLTLEDNSFQFAYSSFSSLGPTMGYYELTDTELVLTEDYSKLGADFQEYFQAGTVPKKFVFIRVGDSYRFEEGKSSLLPRYAYSAGASGQSPVPDQAIFNPILYQYDVKDSQVPIIDCIRFDIDEDGVEEICTLSYGPTSGLFTFVMSVREHDKEEPEYYNVFTCEHYNLSFHLSGSRDMYLFGKKQNGEPEEYCYFDIRFEDGNIALYKEEKDNPEVYWEEKVAYWGEQGVN